MTFLTTPDLQRVRRDLNTAVRKNKERAKAATAYSEMLQDQGGSSTKSNPLDLLVDLREHDMPLHVRVSIDKSIFVGSWYDVVCKGNSEEASIVKREDLIERPDCIVLAFDIETTKLPLKFPDSAVDQIMMISYMIDGQGYLICNREIISTDVEDFEYTPKPEFEGPFIVFNEENELALLQKFFDKSSIPRKNTRNSVLSKNSNWVIWRHFVNKSPNFSDITIFSMEIECRMICSWN